MSAYMAPRQLRVDGVLGQPWVPSRGLLPGCPLATGMMMLALWPLRVALQQDGGSARLYVDDLTYWKVGRLEEAPDKIQQAVRTLLDFADSLQWQISKGKTRIFASSASARQALRALNTGLRVDHLVKDLGIQVAVGAAHRSVLLPARVDAAAARFVKVAHLPLPFEARCRIAAASGSAAGCYGMGANKPSKKDLVILRSAAKQAVCHGGRRAAAEIVLSLLTPIWTLDPAAQAVLMPLIRLAVAISRGEWNRQQWQHIQRSTAASGNGPVAVVLSSMQRLGLGEQVDNWQMPGAPGGRWKPQQHSIQESTAALVQQWQQVQCRELAGRRKLYSHLHGGVDVWATNRLLRKGLLPAAQAGALRTIMAGNFVTQDIAQKWGAEPLCPYCQQQVVESLEHRLWTCPRWELQRLEALRAVHMIHVSPDELRRKVGEGVALTGVAPMDLQLHSLRLNLLELPLAMAPVPGTGSSAVAWTDGSALLPEDPLLARAGWGALVRTGTQKVHLSGPVPGEQTAQRAEAYATLQVLLQVLGPVTLRLCLPQGLGSATWAPVW